MGIKGIVTDAVGEPVVGANVVEKGTTNGVVTDANGAFSLNVSSGAILVISYLGYNTQEISNLNIAGGG
ncbi:MAG: carboxypeptidase-like regulatory domain-containing protein [Tannerella sp.]|nr:carboxypeptidase-like regulatory domain-containing protein [Tannerella sp.]